MSVHGSVHQQQFSFIPATSFVFAAMTVSAAAFAGQPVNFDGWNVTNGVIDTSASCAQAISCATMVVDKGFLQQEVVTASGRFIRQIVTDPGATGSASTLGFASETMIPFDQQARESSPSGWNIDIKQAVRDPSQGFESLAMIERHPHTDAQNNVYDIQKIALEQTISDAQFEAAFKLNQELATMPDGSEVRARELDIDQVLFNEQNGAQQDQRFAFRERGGERVKFDDLLNAWLDSVTKAGELSLDEDSSVSWDDGDTIRSVWIAQRDPFAQDKGFAYQKVENATRQTSATTVARDTAFPIDPFAWDENAMGTAPQLPAVQ